jgi:hypothetical protein
MIVCRRYSSQFISVAGGLMAAMTAAITAGDGPLFREAKLDANGHSIAPSAVRQVEPSLYVTNDISVTVQGDALLVTNLRAPEFARRRVARSPDGSRLTWLLAHDGVAYLAVGMDDQLPPTELRRFDLEKMDWASTLYPADCERPSGGRRDGIIAETVGEASGQNLSLTSCLGAIVPIRRGVAVLTYTFQAHGDSPKATWFNWLKGVAYTVSVFESTGELRWKRSFVYAGESTSPDTLPPQQCTPHEGMRIPERFITGLCVIDGLFQRLLVCAGPKENLICLEQSTGRVAWRIPRIWEHDHIQVGPSSMGSSIGRLRNSVARPPTGQPAHQQPEHEQPDDAPLVGEGLDAAYCARLVLDSLYSSEIVAGPMIVPKSDGDDRRVFVAVARRLRSNWPGAGESIVYEIDTEGQCVSLVRLPRIVAGWPYAVLDGSLVWSCECGGVVRIGRSDVSRYAGFRCAGSWHTTPILWYRDLPLREGSLAFESRSLFSVGFSSDNIMIRGGPSWLTSTDGQRWARCIIEIIELTSGLADLMTLSIPLGADDEGVTYRVNRPTVVGLKLAAEDGLIITLDNGGKQMALCFDADAIADELGVKSCQESLYSGRSR